MLRDHALTGAMNVSIDRIDVVSGARTPDVLHLHILCRCGRRGDDWALDGCVPRMDFAADSCQFCHPQKAKKT